MASVIHGFIYNKAAFDELGLDAADDRGRSSSPSSTRSRRTAPTSRWRWAPTTSGKPRPWATRTSARTTGRARKAALALIKGEQKLTDPQWVAPFTRDRPLEGLPRRRLRGADLPRQPEPLHPRPRRDLPGRLLGDRARSRPRSPAPSRWAPSRRRSPAAGDDCYISDHVDIAIGMNAATRRTPTPRRPSSSGSAPPEFAQLYANALPGLLPAADRRR